ncbi:hypothetical protein Tcan_14689 [Toxocara canis]|uniref:CX domain-containing protein n=1 Tax=Toxocara canis TaxID=6265 RepID=A0A0B2UYZ8_TOXCA|nr:hypothetical protein Tcan_14689 [Toxocara canis]
MLWLIFLQLLALICEARRRGGRRRGKTKFKANFRTNFFESVKDSSYLFNVFSATTHASRSTAAFRKSLHSSPHLRYVHSGTLILISDPYVPFHHGGRAYYWGHRYFDDRDQSTFAGTKCELQLNTTTVIGDVYLGNNETIADYLIWECENTTVCCGVECCDGAHIFYPSFILFSLLIYFLLFFLKN